MEGNVRFMTTETCLKICSILTDRLPSNINHTRVGNGEWIQFPGPIKATNLECKTTFDLPLGSHCNSTAPQLRRKVAASMSYDKQLDAAKKAASLAARLCQVLFCVF